MPGHRLADKRLIILGCWPDRETKALEVDAIRAARRAAQEYSAVLQNIADDSRGFTIMNKHYSFIYVCATA